MPCRNEGGHLATVIKRFPKIIDEIIVVSNRSTDDTVKVAKKLGLKVYEDNRAIKGVGYGFAHITGIKKATGDLIVGIDGDATYPIENLKTVIDYMIKAKVDFVSCNRYPLQDGTAIPLKLRFGVRLLNLECQVLYGKSIKDILSGMWVFKATIKDDLKLTMGDWNLSPQIKINAATSPNIEFSEFSIKQHEREGDTKQQYFKTGLSHLLWIFTNRFRSLVVVRSVTKHKYIYRFIIVGGIAFVFNYAVLLVLNKYIGLNKVASEAVAMLAALQLTFVLHDKWTYAGLSAKRGYRKPLWNRYVTYFMSNSFGSLLTVLLFGVLARYLPNLASLAIAAFIAMIWNFVVNRFYVWQKSHHDLVLEDGEV